MDISNTDASKLGEANCSTREAALTSIWRCWASIMVVKPACVTITPLGLPVDPDV